VVLRRGNLEKHIQLSHAPEKWTAAQIPSTPVMATGQAEFTRRDT